MIFVNMSPLVWDLIIIGILVFGLVTGLFIGGRALLFVSCGNLLAIGLMLAFRSLLMGYFKGWILPLLNSLDTSFLPFRNLLADNIGFIIYVIVWMVGVNILFWTVFLILHFTVLKKHKVEHKGINATFGAIINLARMSVVGVLLIAMMSSSIFGNKSLAFGLTKNEIPENSFMYKFFGGIDNNIPFLKISSSEINTMVKVYQNSKALKTTNVNLTAAINYDQCLNTITDLRTIIALSVDENNVINQALDSIKIGNPINPNKQIIANTLDKYLINNFLDVKFMKPLLLTFQHIINFYPETVQAFVDDLQNVPEIDTTDTKYKPRYDELKPLLDNFISNITDLNSKNKVIITLEKIYKPL